jgi:hypothetical protein
VEGVCYTVSLYACQIDFFHSFLTVLHLFVCQKKRLNI